MEEFFGKSVTGSGGLHAIGFGLPLVWPNDPADRDEMEKNLIAFISFQTELFELREQHGYELRADPLYKTALEQLAHDVSEHWPINERPSVIASFVQRFGAQDDAKDEPND